MSSSKEDSSQDVVSLAARADRDEPAEDGSRTSEEALEKHDLSGPAKLSDFRASNVTAETIKPIDNERDAKEDSDSPLEDADEITPNHDDELIESVTMLLVKDRAANEQQERATDVHIRTSTAAAVAFNDNPKAVETCVKLLKVIISRHRQPLLAHSPVKQFGFEQVYLGAVEILQKIDSEILTHLDIREILNNLADFSHNKLRGENETVRVDFVQALVTLMVAVAELANLLEKLSGLPPIDWMEGSMIIRTQRSGSHSPGQRVDVVIPIAELTSPKLIGTGTFGNVYKVRYKDLWFAMKIVPFSKFPARYPSQAYIDKAVQAIASDFLIGKMFCTFVAKPDCYVMLMDSGLTHPRHDLERVVHAARYFSTESMNMIAYQLICALGSLHLNGFIHRDVCMSNILIDARGHTRLIDFDSGKICRGHFTMAGISKTFFRRTAVEFTDRTDHFSMAYTAPEVLKGISYGRASDWWSVGIVIYKCATGRLPFRAQSNEELQKIILTKKYFWPTDRHSATKEAREFVYDLLRKKPTLRLGSRSYADLHKHPFAEHCVARLLKTRSAGQTGKPDLSTLRQTLHSSGVLVDFQGVLGAVSAVRIEQPGSVRFKDLADAESSSQRALYTYASTNGRKIFDRLERKVGPRALTQVISAFMTSKTPPQEHVDFTNVMSGEHEVDTTDNRSRSDTHIQRLAFNERSSVNLPIRNHRICCCRRVTSVDLVMTVGDGGLLYPAVWKVPELSIPAPVVVGDIIAAVGGQRTGDLTLFNIRNIIHRESAGRQMIAVDVMTRNIFRRIIKEPLELKTFLTIAPRGVVQIPPFRKRHNAVRTTALTLEGFGALYIVSHLTPSARHKIKGNIFFGDVILEVNGQDVKKINDFDFIGVLKAGGAVLMRIAEASVLRRSDLRDAVMEK